ncbi:PEP-CTERM sorting domain-containing protein [Pseudobythopirellula maris]|nr:PEP-CTERM sorting domain-containing protein [Pseudobythopirellula maris]
MLDGTQNFGSTRRSLNFYDVTSITGDGASNPSNVFNQTPLFSVWGGYEDSIGSNFEDPDTFAVNPFNGNVYLMAFDSGPAGVVDSAGDTQGDLDLYEIDYQLILNDFETNSRTPGTMYAPAVGPDGAINPQHPDHFGTTINLADASTKIGEVGRTQGTSFFDRDLLFFDPQTLAYVDNEQDGSDTAAQDHELRIISRISKSNGAAVVDASDSDSILGGYNAQTTESWGTDRVGVLNMDFVGGVATGFSEPEDIVGVDRNGVRGVWVAETDGGGDDFSFYPLVGGAGSGVPATATTIDSLGNSRSLDDDPEFDTATNDGDHDFTIADENGNLIIGDSGFFDTVPGGEAGSGGPAGEPAFIRLNVDSYGATNVTLVSGDAWDDLDEVDGFGPVGSDRAGDDLDPPTQLEGPLGSLTNTFGGGTGLSSDDDSNVTDGRFATYDPDSKVLFLFDIDSGGQPDVVGDVIGINTETGEIVYEESNAANHFFIEHGIRMFRRGDSDGDGDVDADDIDALVAAAVSNGGTSLSEEEFDLTSDDLVTLGAAAGTDHATLVRDILGTEFGDVNLDGIIDITDYSTVSGNFGMTGAGWADGEITGDGIIDITDVSLVSGNFGFDNSALPSVAVPEPASVLLVLMGCAGLLRRRR